VGTEATCSDSVDALTRILVTQTPSSGPHVPEPRGFYPGRSRLPVKTSVPERIDTFDSGLLQNNERY
jgi:hypothetical protein